MRVHHFCFFVAGIAGLAGMGLGMSMGIRQDFSLAPVHAHLNLLGWVTLCLYGLYHRGVARPSERLAWVQVGVAVLSLPLMTGGLAAYFLTGTAAFEVVAILGSVGTVLAMALFVLVLALDLRREAGPAPDPKTQGRLSARPI